MEGRIFRKVEMGFRNINSFYCFDVFRGRGFFGRGFLEVVESLVFLSFLRRVYLIILEGGKGRSRRVVGF